MPQYKQQHTTLSTQCHNTNNNTQPSAHSATIRITTHNPQHTVPQHKQQHTTLSTQCHNTNNTQPSAHSATIQTTTHNPQHTVPQHTTLSTQCHNTNNTQCHNKNNTQPSAHSATIQTTTHSATIQTTHNPQHTVPQYKQHTVPQYKQQHTTLSTQCRNTNNNTQLSAHSATIHNSQHTITTPQYEFLLIPKRLHRVILIVNKTTNTFDCPIFPIPLAPPLPHPQSLGTVASTLCCTLELFSAVLYTVNVCRPID